MLISLVIELKGGIDNDFPTRLALASGTFSFLPGV
jgi:hypothetical protein